MAASTLVFEAMSVFFGGLVAKDLSSLSRGAALLVYGWLALLCLLVCGLLRSPAGYWLGSALQVAVVASGYWVHSMFFIGGLFAVLWACALFYGGRAEARAQAAGSG